MAIAYSIVPSQQLVLIRGWGDLSEALLRAFTPAIQAASGFDPSFRGLYDLRLITGSSASARFLRTEARSPFIGSAPRAVIVNRNELFGLIRMYQTTAGIPDSVLQIFRDLESALAWLGLPIDMPWPEDFPQGVVEEGWPKT